MTRKLDHASTQAIFGRVLLEKCVGIGQRPELGQDNAYVYRSVLGCSDEEIAHLTADGHIGDRYDFEVNE